MEEKTRRARFRIHKTAAALAGILAVCASIPAFAQEAPKKPRIAVLPLKSVDVSAAIAQSVTSLIETALVRTKAYMVVSTTDRDQVLKAQETAITGCDDEECAVQIGRLLAAQQIVVGNVSTLGKKFVISVRIIDITTSQILGAESASATNVEDLEGVCTRLAQSLVASAQSGVVIARTPEAESGPVVREQAPAQGGGFDFLGYAVISGGILFMEAGGAFGVAGFEAMQKSEELYGRYMEAENDFGSLYDEYTGTRTMSDILTISAYSLLGLGAAGVSAGTVLFPPDTYRLSLMGRIAYAAGIACSVSGSTLSLMAGNQAFENIDLYGEYMNAGGGYDALYRRYTDGYNAYSLQRIFSYSLWGLGGAAMAGSFFLPGEKSPIAESLLNKILFAGGTALISGGGTLQTMALNARQLSEERYKAYLEASTGFNALYSDYTASHGQYVLFSALSYGLWAGGAAAVITSLFIPFGDGTARESPELPVSLSLIPIPNGMEVLLHVTLRRPEI